MQRKRRINKKSFGVLLKFFPVVAILFVVVLLFLLVFRMGLFTIKIVKIENSKSGCVNENQLKDTADLLGQNYFFINSKKIEENIKKKFFCIKSLQLSKQLPDKVLIQVFLRQPFALLVNLKDKEASLSALLENISTPSAEQVENYYVVDNEGVVFSKNEVDSNIPRIYINDPKISLGENLRADLTVGPLKILEKVQTFGTEIGESWIRDDLFVVNRNSKPKIIFSLNGNVDVQIASLQLILQKAKIDESKLEFIDLRFDKPVVRFVPRKN